MFVNYAHRGASSYAPENTMIAFKKGVELGANGIELDLQKTKDGKIVIFHDKKINRKSNGKGKIEDYAYKELLELDFGSWFSPEYCNTKITLFEDFAKEYLQKDLTFAIELKVCGIEEDVLKIINKYKKHNNIYITSFLYKALKNIRKIDKNVKISWLVEEINNKNIEKCLKLNAIQICPNAKKLKASDVDLANNNGLGVRLWGVENEDIMKKTYKLNIEGMTVNFPDKLKYLLDNQMVGL